jgi:2-amino-4-hydroxy-6-hydroxymethyldihydropteridine diphosphokinase
MEIGFCLGSNLGNRARLLSQAKALLLLEPHVKFVAQSALYETEPVDVKDEYQQMKFLNAVLIVESTYSAEEWLPKVKKVELALHRKRSEDRNAPRTIDVDILFSGDQVIDSELLTVPHPRWSERRFVIEPLAEVRGNFIMPGMTCSVRNVLDGMVLNDDVRLFAETW